ncbi:MAG: FG-GAP-like repeat-containing protein [Chromatiales bacterium]|nr:FG-GAP-like repeat-containing protein [Chromatiales bacterium]
MPRITGVCGVLTSLIVIAGLVSPAVEAQISFQETTSSAGLQHSGESYGASWGDFNGDGYPDLFVNNHREWSALYRNNGDGTFTDVILTADGSGIWKVKPKQDNHGAAFADFDGDGDQDLYVTTGGADPGLLLVNKNNILYDEAALHSVAQDVEGRLPVWFDFQPDGRLDLAIMVRSASRLYRQKETTPIDFQHITTAAGFSCDEMDYGQLSDLNGDGVMELICGNGTFPRKVYDVTTYPFTDITSTVQSIPRGTDTAIADFDGDLDPDVFVIAGKKIPSEVQLTGSMSLEAAIGVAPGLEKGFSFDTTGQVTFDVYVKRQLSDPENIFIGATGVHPVDMSFTLDPADPLVEGMYPHDPAVDAGVFIGYDPILAQWQVFTSGLEDHAAGSYFNIQSTTAITNPVAINLENGDLPERPYFLNNISGTLTEDGDTRGLLDDVQCVSVASGDFDNDMDVDTYIVCRGGVQNLPNRIYENNGNGTFTMIATGHGAEGVQGFHLADKAGLGDSAITADYDLDGCLDLFVTNGLPLQPGRHDSGPDQIFRNVCNSGNHWIELDLYGSGVGASNPNGLGARVYITAGGVTQMREQNGGYHRWSQSDQRIHFGLAGNTVVDELRIEWPGGLVETFPNAQVPTVAVDQIYEVHEGVGTLAQVVLGGGEFPTPQLGDECGEPEFNAGVHAGIFLWKDCTTGIWSVRATAGWSTSNITYTGSVVSDMAFASVTPVMLEGPDMLDTTVTGQILYDMMMSSGGRDGFDFELSVGASGCFDVSAPAAPQLLLGTGSVPAQWPLDLNTLGSCASGPEMSVDDVTVNEGAGMASFTVSLSAASSEEVRVDYATADGTATDPDDYTAVNGTLILNPGETSGQVDVPIVDDALSEGVETFTLNLTNAVNALVTDAQGIGSITDNEVFACGEPSYDAGTEKGVFLWQDCPSNMWHVRVTAAGPVKVVYDGLVSAEQPFPSAPVPFSLESNDVLDSSDPQATLFTLNVINSGQDGFDFETPATGQTCFEVTSPVDAQVYLGVGKDPVGSTLDLATLGSCSSPPEVTVDDVTVSEGAGMASFTVSLSTASSEEVRVDYATADGTATNPDDYTAVSGTLILAPGETSGQVDVPIIDDALSEAVETFTLNLSNPINAIVIDNQGLGSITDNEAYACGEPDIDRATETGVFLWQDCPTNTWHMRVTAGGGPKITYQGQVSAEQPFPAAPVPFSVEGADWIDSSDPQLILYSLSVSNTGHDGFEFETPATGQTCFEVTAPVSAQVYVGVGKDPVGTSVDLATLGACTPPPPPNPQLSVNDVMVDEGGLNASFTVSLSATSSEQVTVDYVTADGTAVTPDDYTGGGTNLVFNPGETTVQVDVPIVDDSDVEGDETFTIVLTNPVNADIADDTGTGTIQDND